jgi:hypothetical protein
MDTKTDTASTSLPPNPYVNTNGDFSRKGDRILDYVLSLNGTRFVKASHLIMIQDFVLTKAEEDLNDSWTYTCTAVRIVQNTDRFKAFISSLNAKVKGSPITDVFIGFEGPDANISPEDQLMISWIVDYASPWTEEEYDDYWEREGDARYGHGAVRDYVENVSRDND